MEKEVISEDLAKEILAFLAYADNELLKKIPDYVISSLTTRAADSQKNFYVSKSKPLLEQKMTEECKDFLSLLFYAYMSDDETKKEIVDTWISNDLV